MTYEPLRLRIQAHLEAVRATSSAGRRLLEDAATEPTHAEADLLASDLLLRVTKALMDTSVDLAHALDQIAAHVGYEFPSWPDDPQ